MTDRTDTSGINSGHVRKVSATDKLLPCPFCGYMPQVSSYEYHLPLGKVYGTQWKVECMDDNCPAQPTVDWHYFTREEAIAAWNRRADHD